MDAIASRQFIATIDGQISETVGHLYTYLHTLESLLSIKKKFNQADHRFFDYIKKITELHYMITTGRIPRASAPETAECLGQPDDPDETLNIQDLFGDQPTTQPANATPGVCKPEKRPTVPLADIMDTADAQMDRHIEDRRKELLQTTACPPVPKHPIKWLTDQAPDVAPRVERIEINMDDFEVVEEKTADSADIIAALEARKTAVEPAPVPTSQPASLSARTAEALGVKFCTPDDEPATVNALFKIGPRHREMLYTKLYKKAKANIAALNPEESKVNELVRLETDRLLAEWIAAH
jgi:hypothetical protein